MLNQVLRVSFFDSFKNIVLGVQVVACSNESLGASEVELFVLVFLEK